MSDSWSGELIAGIIGFVSAIATGYITTAISKGQRRRHALRMLRRELSEFVDRLFLAPIKPGELSLVSTINVSLLEQVFQEDIWDYEFDAGVVGILADLIERIKRYNDAVQIANSFTFGEGLDSDRNWDIQEALHSSLQSSMATIDQKVKDLVAALDLVLSAPGA